MNKKKYAIILVVVILMVLLATTCSNKRNTIPTKDIEESTEEVSFEDESESILVTEEKETLPPGVAVNEFDETGFDEGPSEMEGEAASPELREEKADSVNNVAESEVQEVVVETATTEAEGGNEDVTLPSSEIIESFEENQNATVITEYEKYHAMSGSEQKKFVDTFDSPESFFEWYNKAKEEYESIHPAISVDNGTIDMGEILGNE